MKSGYLVNTSKQHWLDNPSAEVSHLKSCERRLEKHEQSKQRHYETIGVHVEK